jgi:3-methyladenine DNA glycosylase AlkD
MAVRNIISELKSFGSPERAKHSLRFFKTGKGEYGENDKFLGCSVPQMRLISRKYRDITVDDAILLLHESYHECRLVALLILVDKYSRAEKRKDESEMKKIYSSYLNNTGYINNWDLVDSSAHNIVGSYLYSHPKEISTLFRLAHSEDLWEKRIAIIATFYYIRKGDFNATLNVSESLLQDKHDLIHKATGWMLREVGKKNQDILEKFLDRYSKTMPRTMLRYAIEKFDEKKKKYYMQK